jgi:hypothetical protein
MIVLAGFWFFLAAIYLFIMSLQDVFNKCLVDDRFNYFMLGASVFLIMQISKSWQAIIIYIILFTLFILFQNIALKNLVGKADTTALSWLTLTLTFLSYKYIITFIIIYSFVILFSSLLIFILAKVYKKGLIAPFFPVIFGSFIITYFFIT